MKKCDPPVDRYTDPTAMGEWISSRTFPAPNCPEGDGVPEPGWRTWSKRKLAVWLSDVADLPFAASTLQRKYNRDSLIRQVERHIGAGQLDRELCLRVRRMIAQGDGQGNINHNRLVILNMGLGRDSMTMLGLLAEGRLIAEGHRVRPQDVDAIVFSDAGAEWDHSYRLIDAVSKTAKKLKIPFYWLKKPLACDWKKYLSDLRTLRESHPHVARLSKAAKADVRQWRKGREHLSPQTKAQTGYYHFAAPIIEDYRFDRPSGPMLPGYGEKACTVNHKIAPIRRLMDDLSVQKFGKTVKQWSDMVRCAQAVPHLNLVGITWDEHSDNPQTRKPRNSQRHPYNPKRSVKGPFWVDEAYPLAEMKIPKSGEQQILERHGWGHVRKSGCFMCPYQPVEWYWLLHHKAGQGEPWAQASYQRVRAAERDRFNDGVRKRRQGRMSKSRSYPIYVVLDDKRVQAHGRPTKTNKHGKEVLDPRRGEDQLLLDAAIPIVQQIYIQPRIRFYRGQGMSARDAQSQVIEEILLKDYAQGCKKGSTNRHTQRLARQGFSQWTRCCPRHG